MFGLHQEIHGRGSEGALFGSSVAQFDDVLVVGGIGDSMESRKHTGAVYVFQYIKQNEFSVQQMLYPNGIASYDQFGCSVAIGKNFIAVGSLNGKVYSEGFSVNSGVVNVWTRFSQRWTHSALLIPQPVEAYAEFGASIQVSGDVMIVGAVGDASSCDGCGAVYVYQRNKYYGWSFTSKLSVNDGSSRFGENIALYDDDMVVSAQHETGAHVVYSFHTFDASWTSNGLLSLPSHATALALSQSTAFIGMSELNGCGAVFMYRLHSRHWSHTNTLRPVDCSQQLHFGDVIAVAENITIIGAYGYRNTSTSRVVGAVYVFASRRDVWSQQQLLSEGRLANDNYGRAMTIDNGMLVVTASGDDFGSNNAGGGFVYISSSIPEGTSLSASDGDASIAAVVGGAAVILCFIFLWYIRSRCRRRNKGSFDALGDSSASKSVAGDDSSVEIEVVDNMLEAHVRKSNTSSSSVFI